MKVDVIMPQMGESIAEGTVLRYLKKVGEAVGRDEDVLEISTDKVDATVPSPAAGVLAEILVPEGETVEVNAVLARIETEAGAAVDAGAPPAGEAAPEPAAAPEAGAATAPVPAAPAGAGAAGAAGKVAAGPGAAPEAPAPDAAREGPAPCAPVKGMGPPSLSVLGPARRADRIPSKEELRRTRSTPLVRRMAREHGIDISRIQGTGLSGRVTRKDITEYIASGGAAGAAAAAAPGAAPGAAAPTPAVPVAPPVAFAPGETVHVEPMSVVRRKIAEHMVASRRTSAHVHTVFEVDMTAVEALRARHKARWEEREGIKLTYMPFILKAAIEALKAFPIVNASTDGDKILYHKSVNLGVAVALDWGLIVPVIKNADEKNLLGLARAVQDLASRARARKLVPEEVQASTFTVTNPGAIGALYGTPIINQPNLAILGVGGVQKRAVVINDAIAIRPMVHMVLGFDHRIIDGAVADYFMAHLKATLERGTFTDLG